MPHFMYATSPQLSVKIQDFFIGYSFDLIDASGVSARTFPDDAVRPVAEMKCGEEVVMGPVEIPVETPR